MTLASWPHRTQLGSKNLQYMTMITNAIKKTLKASVRAKARVDGMAGQIARIQRRIGPLFRLPKPFGYPSVLSP
jgi:hypothetical protein